MGFNTTDITEPKDGVIAASLDICKMKQGSPKEKKDGVYISVYLTMKWTILGEPGLGQEVWGNRMLARFKQVEREVADGYTAEFIIWGDKGEVFVLDRGTTSNWMSQALVELCHILEIDPKDKLAIENALPDIPVTVQEAERTGFTDQFVGRSAMINLRMGKPYGDRPARMEVAGVVAPFDPEELATDGHNWMADY